MIKKLFGSPCLNEYSSETKLARFYYYFAVSFFFFYLALVTIFTIIITVYNTPNGLFMISILLLIAIVFILLFRIFYSFVLKLNGLKREEK